MTLALTAFEAVSRPIQGPTKKRGVQEVRLTVTGANTDTLWDLSAITAGALGTFWTAATADATYGALATAALADFRNIQAQAENLRQVAGEVIVARVQVVSVTAVTQYAIAVNSHLPDITWRTGDAPTTAIIVLEIGLKDGVFPIHSTYG